MVLAIGVVTVQLFSVLSHLVTFPVIPAKVNVPEFVPEQTVALLFKVPPSDNGSIVYTAQFYKQSLDRLDLPNRFCSRVLIGNGKNYDEIKRPLFISNKVQLELPI